MQEAHLTLFDHSCNHSIFHQSFSFPTIFSCVWHCKSFSLSLPSKEKTWIWKGGGGEGESEPSQWLTVRGEGWREDELTLYRTGAQSAPLSRICVYAHRYSYTLANFLWLFLIWSVEESTRLTTPKQCTVFLWKMKIGPSCPTFMSRPK